MIFLFSGRKLHPSFSLLLLRLSYSFAFTIRSHFYQHCCDRTPTQPTNLFCIMAQIRRRCLTLNDHTLINSYHPRQHPPQHPHSSSGSGCPRAQSFPLAPFVLSGDDSDSYTSLYISPEPSLSLSHYSTFFVYFFLCRLRFALKWPLHKIV